MSTDKLKDTSVSDKSMTFSSFTAPSLTGSIRLLSQHPFNCILSFPFSNLFRNFTWFANYEYGNCYVFGALDMTQNISAPGNQNGELFNYVQPFV